MRFLILLCFFLAASAATAKDFVVGVVDMQELYKQYPGTTKAQKKFDELAQEKRQDLADLESALRDLQGVLSDPKGALSSRERKQKEKEFEEANQNYQEEKNRIQNELQERNQEMMEKLTVRIKDVIIGIAKKYQIALVLNKNDVVGVKNGVDLTTEVLRTFAELKPEATDLDSSTP